MLTLTIQTDNDAFHGEGNARNYELARILRSLAQAVESDQHDCLEQLISDSYGNTCGILRIE